MGNEQARYQAIGAPEENRREFVRLRQELDTLQNEAKVQEVTRQRDVLKVQAELIKGMSLIQEEMAKKEKDHREEHLNMMIIIGIILFIFMFFSFLMTVLTIWVFKQ